MFIQKFTSVVCLSATFRFPITAAASPMRLPKNLIVTKTATSLLNCWCCVTEVPSSWMTFAGLFVILAILINFSTRPIQANLVFQIHLFFFICSESNSGFAWVLWLIRLSISEETTISSIKLKVSFSSIWITFPVVGWISQCSIEEILFGFFIRIFNKFM